MTKLVARLFATASLCMGSNPDFSQTYKMGDIRKGVANTLLARQTNQKKSFSTVFNLGFRHVH
jgi:hypothetical protein